MPRTSYKKWRTMQDLGIRPGYVLPAWNVGDLVEVIGSGLVGRITRCTTLDYTMWEFEALDDSRGSNRFFITHANNLRAVLTIPARHQ